MASLHTMRDQTGRFAKSQVPTKSVLSSDQTGAQQPAQKGAAPWLMGAFGAGLPSFGGMGTWQNPMSFPGYEGIYYGSPITYRWMLCHPVLRLVRSIRKGVIAASNWEYEKSVDAPENWRLKTKETFDKLRDDMITEFFARGQDMGWHSGEPIWEYREGRVWLVRVKPMLQDVTEVLEDDFGNFVGLKNNVRVKDKPYAELPGPYKAWKYAYDSDCGYHYGRSWLENCRSTAWKSWLNGIQQIERLGAKIVGTTTVITAPSGYFEGPPDSSGRPTRVSYRQNAEDAIKALAAGAAGVYFPSLGLGIDAKGSLDAMKVLSELAGKSLTNIEVLDHGSITPAIEGILARMEHDEELMFNAGLRASRTGLEAKHGAKQDAEVFTDTGTLNAEEDDRNFAKQCTPLVDADLVLNFGEQARGKVWIKTPSLVDRKTGVLKAILLSMMNIPVIAQALAETALDVDKIIDQIGADRKGDFDPKAITRAEQQKASANGSGTGTQNNETKQKKTPEPQGGRPPQE